MKCLCLCWFYVMWIVSGLLNAKVSLTVMFSFYMLHIHISSQSFKERRLFIILAWENIYIYPAYPLRVGWDISSILNCVKLVYIQRFLSWQVANPKLTPSTLLFIYSQFVAEHVYSSPSHEYLHKVKRKWTGSQVNDSK